jgi:hypothetical protein
VRADTLRKLLILAGLRGLGAKVEEESRNMPVTLNIMDHDVLGPAIRKGIEEGRALGLEEGERQLFQMQLERRFGRLPGWVDDRLAGCSVREIEELALRLLDVKTLEELFV